MRVYLATKVMIQEQLQKLSLEKQIKLIKKLKEKTYRLRKIGY